MAIVLLRTLLLYLVIIVSLRLMGKRQLAQLQPGELVITILISDIATLPLQDTDIPLIGGILPILCLVALEVLISDLTAKSHRVRRLLYGREVVLIERGILNQKNMKDLRYTADDLLCMLRTQGIFDLKDVDFAIVHPDGSFGVYPVYSEREATKGDLGKKSNSKIKAEENISFVVASEGEINLTGLNALGLEKNWPEGIARANGKRVRDIFLMTAKSRNDYTLIWKEGKNQS